MRMSADDWQLYTCSMKCGRAAAAMTKELNALLKSAQADILRRPELQVEKAIAVRNAMQATMHKYSEYGACDTEPQWALVDAINKVLGTRIDRW